MFTRNIKCGACGFEGKIESAASNLGVDDPSSIFISLGAATHGSHFLCPCCKSDLEVAPLGMANAILIVGTPVPRSPTRALTRFFRIDGRLKQISKALLRCWTNFVRRRASKPIRMGKRTRAF